MRDKLIRSRYFILINSNVSINTTTDIGKKHLQSFLKGMKEIFLSKNILNFIKIKDENDINIPKEKLIADITIEANLEYGDKNDYLHAHADVAIDHKTTLMLVTNRIVKYFAEKYNLSVFIPPPRIISDNSIAVKTYSRKMHIKHNFLYIFARLIQLNGETETYTQTIK